MTKSKRLVTVSVAVTLLISGIGLFKGWVQPALYHAGFSAQQAAEILSRFDTAGIEVDKVLMHTVSNGLLKARSEKFVVSLKYPLEIPTRKFMAEDKGDYWNTQGRWLYGESEWPWAFRGVQMSVACAHNPIHGAIAFDLDNWMTSNYSFIKVPKNQSNPDIEAIIHNARDNTLTYVHCNY